MSSQVTGEVWKRDDLVRRYLAGIRSAVPLRSVQIDVMMRLMRALGRPVESFLDLGCGDGILAGAVLSEFPDARGTLVDFSTPMLEAARERFTDSIADLAIIEADFSAPIWVDSIAGRSPFDVVVSGFSIHHQPDDRKRELYGEIHNLLAPGGLFLNNEHVASASEWVEGVWDEYITDALHAHQLENDPAVTRDKIRTDYVHRPDKAANILAPVEVQCDWLRAIGFSDVDCYFKAFELAVFGGRRKDG